VPSRDFMVNRQLPWIEPCIYLKPPELSLAHQEGRQRLSLCAKKVKPFEQDSKGFRLSKVIHRVIHPVLPRYQMTQLTEITW
jgi:hypothetical protein